MEILHPKINLKQYSKYTIGKIYKRENKRINLIDLCSKAQ